MAMIVVCEACGHKNTIKNYEAFRGMKNVVFSCKNKSCKQKVKFYLPNEKSEEKERSATIVVNEGQKVDSTHLEYGDVNGELINVEIELGVHHVGRKSNGYNQEIAVDTNDKYMSRMHAVIVGKSIGGSHMCVLSDYNSKNKVLLNGRVLEENEEVFLMDGDKIILGKTELVCKAKYKVSEG